MRVTAAQDAAPWRLRGELPGFKQKREFVTVEQRFERTVGKQGRPDAPKVDAQPVFARCSAAKKRARLNAIRRQRPRKIGVKRG